MFDRALVQAKHTQAIPYGAFVATGEPEGHHLAWNQRYDQCRLDEHQRVVVESFVRSMKVLCLTGTWCGDCALQGAAMQRIAEASHNLIDLRFLSRIDHADLQVKHPINGGMRVPLTFFMAEDFEPAALFGDRTLSRYRSMARKALGDDPERCNVWSPAPADPVRTVLSEVLDIFERVQLLLRLSPRLRRVHND